MVLSGVLQVHLKLMSSVKESMRSLERSMRTLRDRSMVVGVEAMKLLGVKRETRKERKSIERSIERESIGRRGGRRMEDGSLRAFRVVVDRTA